MKLSLRAFLPAGALALAVFAAAPAGAFQAFAPEPPPPPEPPDAVRGALYALRAGGASAGSYLGVMGVEIDNERAKALRLSETRGVELTRVEEDSPALKAGLKSGDVVLEYNGQRVEGMEQFVRLVRETPAGREVRLLISRNGATQTVPVTVATRKMKTLPAFSDSWAIEMPNFPPMPDMANMPNIFTTWRASVLGVESETLGPQLAEYFGVKEGVLVRSVMKGSSAEKAGLKAGDVIVKIDQTAVGNPGDLSAAIRSVRSRKTFPLELIRDRHAMTLNVTVDEDRSEHAAPSAPHILRGRTVKM
jgi:serine protease Do